MNGTHARTLFLSLLLIFLIPVIAVAQESGSCAETLKNAQTLFTRGQVEKVPGVLRQCMKSGFKREEELAAYKILIQSYLLEDKLDQADSTMLAFLKKYPEYQISETDHPSFVSLYKNFKVRQLAHLTIHLGTNIPFLTNIDDHSVAPEPGDRSYSSELLNMFGSFEIKVPVNPKFEANLEIGFLQSKFRNTESFQGYIADYSETMQRIEMPLTITWNFARISNKLTAFARAGGGPVFNLSSTAVITTTGSDDNNHNVISGPELDRSGSRIFMDMFLQAGAGIKFKTPGGFISLEARSNFGMSNQVIKNYDNSTMELINKYSWIDDDFILNNLNINIGYTQIFYKPSKRKQGE
jgi:hypothetical protein